MPTTPDPSSANAPSTWPPADSSDETATAKPTTSTTSWTRAITHVNLEQLSPTSRATRILIGDPHSDGYPITEIADSLGQPASWVSTRLQELREELLLASGHFFPLTDHEYQALEQSCLVYGIQVDVLLGEHIPLIDGRHRLLIAQKHGLEAPCRLLQGLSPDEEHDIAVGLNAARRQLNRAQKRTLVQAELMRNPARSDRLIASVCGVHWDTVGAIRSEIAEAQRAEQEASTVAESVNRDRGSAHDVVGELGHSEHLSVAPPERIGRDGVAQPSRPLRPAPPPPVPAGEPLGYVTCSHGQRHAIYRSRGTYRLEPRETINFDNDFAIE